MYISKKKTPYYNTSAFYNYSFALEIKQKRLNKRLITTLVGVFFSFIWNPQWFYALNPFYGVF